MKTEIELMQATAREIILDSLTGALTAHNPHWAVIPAGTDPVVDALSDAVKAVARAYPAPADPMAVATFAELFGTTKTAEETIGLEWNELWDAMRNAPSPWVKTTENMFFEMLGAVPPTDMFAGAFLVGEASHTSAAGEDVFACFVEHTDGTFEARYMTQREFDAWKAIHQEGKVTK